MVGWCTQNGRRMYGWKRVSRELEQERIRRKLEKHRDELNAGVLCDFASLKQRGYTIMVLRLMIRDFGKVKSANISLDDFVMFVGNNNSGKTMIMQLIYGIRKELWSLDVASLGAKRTDLSGQYLIRCDGNWFQEMEIQINKYLDMNKSRIVKNIFGMPIKIGEMKVALEDMEAVYFVSSISEVRNEDLGEQGKEISIDIRQYENGENTKTFEHRILRQGSFDDIEKEVLKAVWRVILAGKVQLDSEEQLFLPASRSGLQLLYKYYFVSETGGGMAAPLKDFLRFLQLYNEDKMLGEYRENLVEFGEEYLLEGVVSQAGEETFYIDRHEGRVVPLYIASSMIHELTPFIKALNATWRIDWLFCDEIENSLHPLMQREMSRWLIRMVNAGMHVIISSHSDTMASRLNNLFMLADLIKRKGNYDLLPELGLENADLLRPNIKMGVYEFRDDGQGKSVVERLEFISHPLMGYDFQLFGSNIDKLYDEADKITR